MFAFDLPKGRYDVLVICGDADEKSGTAIRSPKKLFVEALAELDAGEFKAVQIPVIQPQDGLFELEFGEINNAWSVCAVMVTKDYCMM